MAGETVITVIGNVTKDPEVRFSKLGMAVVSLTVASTPKNWDKNTGKFVDGQTLFMKVSAFGSMAENIGQSLSKGDRVIAHGKLKQDQYEKDGVKVTVFELVAEEVGPSLKFSETSVNRLSRSATTTTDAFSSPAASTDAAPF